MLTFSQWWAWFWLKTFLNFLIYPSTFCCFFLTLSVLFSLLIFCFLGYLRKRNSPTKWYLVAPRLGQQGHLGHRRQLVWIAVPERFFFVGFFFYIFVGLCTFEQVPIWWRNMLYLLFFHSELCFCNLSMWTDTPIINFWLMWNIPLCEYIIMYLSIFKSMKLEPNFSFLLLLMKLQRVFSCVPSHAQLGFPRRCRTWWRHVDL